MRLQGLNRGLMAGVLFVVATGTAPTRANDLTPRQSVDAARAVAADLHLMAGYLERAIGPEGRMHYVRDSTGARALHEGATRYNLLRHAGAMYALSTFQRHCPDPARAEALRRAARFLISCCVGPVEGAPGALAVWSHPEVTGRRSGLTAKLGGAGLGLVALSSLATFDHDGVDPRVLEGLARFIRFMQKPSGAFYSKFTPGRVGRDDRWTSLYYPGEAALGLLYLYDLDPRLEWLDGAARALDYLARAREGQVPPPDHWALIATAKLFRVRSDAPHLVHQPRLVTHVQTIVHTMLGEQSDSAAAFPGAFTGDGRLTPTATRIEGLHGAREVLSGHHETMAAIDRSIAAGLGFLSRGIIREGSIAGGVPRAIGTLPEDGSKARSRFNRRAGEVRIDYVQHAMSAMLGGMRFDPGSMRRLCSLGSDGARSTQGPTSTWTPGAARSLPGNRRHIEPS